MYGTYFAILFAWAFSFYYSGNWSFGYYYLYNLIIAVGCSLYGIVTLIRVIRSKGVGLST
jgi:hypothetical protein